MLIKVVDQIIDEDLHSAAWQLYQDCFEELNTLAVQRHMMYRSEFDEVMKDTRVDKYWERPAACRLPLRVENRPGYRLFTRYTHALGSALQRLDPGSAAVLVEVSPIG